MSIKIELEFIPVAERLPEDDASYFVCYEAADFDICRFNLLNKSFNSLCPELTITHWAKLPDLSKASENNSRSEFKERILKEIAANREAKNPQEQRRRDLFERVLLDALSEKKYFLLKFTKEKKIKERWDGTKMEVPCDVLLPELLDDEYEELRVKTEAYLKAADKFAREE
jgi:hypothetical protein